MRSAKDKVTGALKDWDSQHRYLTWYVATCMILILFLLAVGGL